MGLSSLIAVAIGAVFGMVLGTIIAAIVGGPPLGWIALGAGVGGTYMAAAAS